MHRLISLLYHPLQAIVLPALRSCGNILTGDDLQMELMMHCGVLPALTRLFESSTGTMLKEVIWCFSNIAAGNSAHKQRLIDANVCPRIINTLVSDVKELHDGAAWTIFNLTEGGKKEQIA